AFQPLVAPAESFQLIREAGRNVGLTRAAPSALPAEPSGDLAGLVRVEELVDPARTEAGWGRDLANRQPRLMGFDEGPDSLALGVVQVLRGEAEACGNLLLAANPLLELVVGFHSSTPTMSPVAVQQTGRLMAASCSDATRLPDSVGSGPVRRPRLGWRPSCPTESSLTDGDVRLKPDLHTSG